jgi:hypothetical protein
MVEIPGTCEVLETRRAEKLVFVIVVHITQFLTSSNVVLRNQHASVVIEVTISVNFARMIDKRYRTSNILV